MVSCGQLVTLRPCSDSGMPVHHQTGTHLPETWEGIRDTASPLRPCSLWRAGLFSTPLQPHIFHHGLPTCAQIFKYFLSFHLFSFALLFYLLRQLVPLCSPFVHLPPPPLCQPKTCPRANNITDTRTPFSSCFYSHSLPSSAPLTRDVKQRSASCEHIHQCQAKYYFRWLTGQVQDLST